MGHAVRARRWAGSQPPRNKAPRGCRKTEAGQDGRPKRERSYWNNTQDGGLGSATSRSPQPATCDSVPRHRHKHPKKLSSPRVDMGSV